MTKRIIRRVIAVFGAFLLWRTLSGCAAVVNVERTDFLMNTVAHITIRDAPKTKVDEQNAEQILDEAFTLLREIEQLCSAKLPESELTFINENAYEHDVPVSDELFGLIAAAYHYCELSGGAFDITLGKLSDLWGFGTENENIPDSKAISSLLTQGVGYEYLVLDTNAGTIRFTSPAIKLDLGGIAKGYASDRVRDLLVRRGVRSAVIDLGGNILLVGIPDSGNNPWRVGIKNPRFDETDKSGKNIFAVAELSGGAVVTSGDYERFFIENGARYHHILDRSTGYPASGGYVSVSILDASATEADALSTACFVLGTDGAADLAGSLGAGYIFIDENMTAEVSDGIKAEMAD